MLWQLRTKGPWCSGAGRNGKSCTSFCKFQRGKNVADMLRGRQEHQLMLSDLKVKICLTEGQGGRVTRAPLSVSRVRHASFGHEIEARPLIGQTTGSCVCNPPPDPRPPVVSGVRSEILEIHLGSRADSLMTKWDQVDQWDHGLSCSERLGIRCQHFARWFPII